MVNRSVAKRAKHAKPALRKGYWAKALKLLYTEKFDWSRLVYDITYTSIGAAVVEDFYEESGGGLTLSGGEIFAQFEFAKAILKAAKEVGLHTAIETTAFVEHEKFVDLIQYVDFIYTDLKHYNTLKHKKVVGVNNHLIIKNIHYAFAQNKTIVLRIPVIPNFNDSLNDAEEFASLFNSLDIDEVQLLPFHQFGENKYKLLGRRYEMEGIKALHPEDLYDYQQVFLDHDIHCYF